MSKAKSSKPRIKKQPVFLSVLSTLSEPWRDIEPEIIDENLYEHRKLIGPALFSKENTTIVAPMGSGKTYSILKMCEDIRRNEKKLRFVFVVPLISIAHQKKKEMLAEEKIELGFIHSGIAGHPNTNNSIFLSYFGSRKTIICVYDQMYRFQELITDPKDGASFKDALKNTVLIVDEAHNLVTQSDFRFRAISLIANISPFFRNTVFLTGTPEGAMITDHKYIIFKKQMEIRKSRIEIISYKDGVIEKLVYHCLTREGNGKTIILFDNKKELDKVKYALMHNSIRKVEQNNIKVLKRETASEEFYLQMLEEEQIQNEVEFILTTRLIADGVNIKNEDIKSVYVVNCRDYLLKRQFISRFRNGFQRAYDFVPYHQDSVLTPFRSYLTEIKRDLREIQLMSDQMKNLSNASMRKELRIAHKLKADGTAPKDKIYLNEIDGSFVVAEQPIIKNHLDEFHTQLLCDPEKAKQYYEHFATFECGILQFENEFDMSGTFIEQPKENSIAKEFEEFLTTYYWKNERNNFNNYSNIGFIKPNLDIDKFYTRNKRLFSNDAFREKIKKSLHFLRMGIPYYPVKELFLLGYDENNTQKYNKYVVQLEFSLYKQGLDLVCGTLTSKAKLSKSEINLLPWQLKLILYISTLFPKDGSYCISDCLAEAKEYSQQELSKNLDDYYYDSILRGIFTVSADRRTKVAKQKCRRGGREYIEHETSPKVLLENMSFKIDGSEAKLTPVYIHSLSISFYTLALKALYTLMIDEEKKVGYMNPIVTRIKNILLLKLALIENEEAIDRLGLFDKLTE